MSDVKRQRPRQAEIENRPSDSENKKQPYGFQRHNDLLQITCSLASNPSVWPNNYTISSLVAVADNILKEIESKSV